MCDQVPTPTLNDSTPEPEPSGSFPSYLLAAILSDPRTKAQIGSTVRSVLIAFGSTWAATHADSIDLLAGILLALVSAAWGIYQKYRVDRKIKRITRAATPAT